jgi:hypothetical protein
MEPMRIGKDKTKEEGASIDRNSHNKMDKTGKTDDVPVIKETREMVFALSSRIGMTSDKYNSWKKH